jgi:hypothetical protein
MKKSLLLLSLLVVSALSATSQINFSANDFGRVPVYNGYFQYGTNMGYYGPTWDDKTLADIAAGNPAKNVKGAGSKSFHLPLPEQFLEFWGYNVRVDMFNHYAALGVKDNAIFLEEPKSDHRDNTNYGCAQSSRMFKNMYEPIWDGGANGTPVNDNNYMALYIYKTVTTYKSYVKYWEIINEPDLEYGILGDGDPGQPGNWWDNNPNPCALPNLYAPIFHYIRALRIGYEVIKYVDPTAYVAPGGLGKPAFLDAILRNTDNPDNGAVSAAYPLKGGAYFDALSFHNYPIYHLHAWDNSIFGFTFKRHSDAAVAAYIAQKDKFVNTLVARGYNNTTYPAKHIITTETNVPNQAVNGSLGPWIGGQEVQRNYVIKAAVESQRSNIDQLYLFVLGNDKNFGDPTASELSYLGLYKNLVGAGPLQNGGVYNHQYNESGIAHKTMSDELLNKRYDAARTTALALPGNVGGAAFKDAAGAYTYVLWAKTGVDQSENASATYSFPAGLVSAQLTKKEWNFSSTGAASTISSTNVALTGAPIFLSGSSAPPPPPPPPTADCSTITITPATSSISLGGLTAPVITVHVFNSSWATVFNQTYTNSPGTVNIPSLSPGTYNVKINFYTSSWNSICEKFQSVVVQNTPPPPPPPPTGTPNCNTISIVPQPGALKLKGLISPVAAVQVFNSSWATVFNQTFTNSPDSILIPSLAAGTYNVKVSFYNASWSFICEKFEPATVSGSGAKSAPGSVGAPVDERAVTVASSISVAPNPFVNNIQVSIGSGRNENAQLVMIDVSGREVYRKPVSLQQGLNRFQIDGSRFRPGSYYLKLITATRTESVKLIRQ